MLIAIGKVFARIGRWLMPSELNSFDQAQLQELARDVGVTTDDLCRLVAEDPESAQLLPERLRREEIDVVLLQAKWPSVYKDLQRVCSLCGHKEVCEREMKECVEGSDWKKYCPNAHTFDTLR